MAIVTHGTTLAGFKAIMAGVGKSDLGSSPWTVSDNDGKMYFYHVGDTACDWGHDLEDEDCDVSEAINVTCNQSFESARLQYAVQGKGGTVVVLVCDIPDDSLELDYSCFGDSDRMPNARSIDCAEFNPSWIIDIKVGEFNHWHSPLVLSGVWSNDLFNTDGVDEGLAQVVECARFGCEAYESLYDFELESVDVKEFIKENA